jgi:hypothetical protein
LGIVGDLAGLHVGTTPGQCNGSAGGWSPSAWWARSWLYSFTHSPIAAWASAMVAKR